MRASLTLATAVLPRNRRGCDVRQVHVARLLSVTARAWGIGSTTESTESRCVRTHALTRAGVFATGATSPTPAAD